MLDAEWDRSHLEGPDRGLLQELVFGVVRWQGTLDWLIDRKTAGKEQKSGLRILLRLGLYQIFWLDRIPDHAAVNETVNLAKILGFGPQAGFVNAVLRGCLREKESIQSALAEMKTSQPAVGYSHPQWLCERWEQRWGGEVMRQLLDWNNTPPKTYARVNNLRVRMEALREAWSMERVNVRLNAYDWAGDLLVYELQEHPPLPAMNSFRRGYFYVQDPSTLLAVRELRPQPGEVILDYCAAPGGKTTLIAQCMENKGRIVAHDADPSRLYLVKENCVRLGATCVECAKTEQLPPAGKPVFDRILVDAPCSNTGVLRRRLDLRWRLRPEELQRLAVTQGQILTDVAPRLKPGGVLIYSTCSMEPEENSGVVRQFLEKHPDFSMQYDRSLTPFQDKVDGAYVARLVRKG